MELCSMLVVIRWSPGETMPLSAMLRAIVAFRVKITREGSAMLKRAATFSLTSKTALAARRDSVWPPRPGFPPRSLRASRVALCTASGFGKVLDALSKYTGIPTPTMRNESTGLAQWNLVSLLL